MSRNLSAAKATDAAPVFAALGDRTRLRVIARLCDGGPQSITRITEGANVTRQAVTKHLHALADAGLVRGRRAGREQIWELQTARLAVAHQYLDRISERWDEAVGRLKAFVEK